MDTLLTGLRAAGEPTRLRLLALCAHGELAVSELTQILGQSQPRVSRHLKLLVEAGLLERFREGALVYYRIAENSEAAHLARTLVDLLPENEGEINRDLVRLEQIRRKRAEAAAVYFKENADSWDRIRSLHVAKEQLEREFLDVVGRGRFESFLDIGTGTGRILELLANQIERGLGIDQSPEMLALARSHLEKANLKHVHVRKGDMYNVPVENESFDLTALHLVLHYSLEPGLVISEAARTLKPGGRLVIVDFAPHEIDQLRTEHQHQRLGFADPEVCALMADSGLIPGDTRAMAGDPLTVNIWQAEKPDSGGNPARFLN